MAYPWNWAPILAQEKTQCIPAPPEDICWPATVDPNQEQAGYYLGLGPRGQLGLHLALNGRWQVCASDDFAVGLRTWYHTSLAYLQQTLRGEDDGNDFAHEVSPVLETVRRQLVRQPSMAVVAST